MSTYAIGDLQGCYDELQDLLDVINFDESRDLLWFCGDIVNRGPKSLQCLQFVMQTDSARTVLGNHDLHLLAVALNVRPPHRKDTFDQILQHPDKDKFLNWVRAQPLMLHDAGSGFSMIHAGLFPGWSIKKTSKLAREVEKYLQGNQYESLIQVMYGDEPDDWSDQLIGYDRVRCIINALTRMRYLHRDGHMDFSDKGAPGKQANHLLPWFQHPDRKSCKDKIVFGHWSTVYLGNEIDFTSLHVYPLDTGCLWGGELTALRLEDEKWFSVPSRQK